MSSRTPPNAIPKSFSEQCIHESNDEGIVASSAAGKKSLDEISPLPPAHRSTFSVPSSPNRHYGSPRSDSESQLYSPHSPQTSALRRHASFHVPELRDHPSLGRSVGPSDFFRLQLLGKGDVGRVYLVKEKNSSQLYAMKVLNKKELIRRKKVERIMSERAILTTINHPFLISMYHSFQSEENLFFIITYCPGGEFFRVLQNHPRKSLPESAVKFYSAEVVLALEYLHTQGIVYRDLKPENLLLSADGHIKLADFDLSKRMNDPESYVANVARPKRFWDRLFSSNPTPTLKRTNSFVGTEEYLAPEIVLGQGHDASVDWWTLGVLVYEMMFGKTPFRGKNREETFLSITSGDIIFPRLVDVTNDCKNLIRRLLQKQYRKRLGGIFGAPEIKEHPFYADIRWALVRNQTPPIVPHISHPYDTSNFSYSEDTNPIELERERPLEDILDPHGFFTNFSYHRKPMCNIYDGIKLSPKAAEQ